METTSTTKTTPLSTGPIGIEKLYGKDLSEYDDIDVDTLLSQLSPEEINLLAKEVDPDDSFLPPNQRCSYDCEKTPTGPLNRKKLIEHINKQAIEEPDVPEFEPYVKGTVRGKKWIPPPQSQREMDAEEQIAIDMGEEYEHALSSASQEEIIDLAAILGFHSMMNQDQYHASLLNKGQPVGLGWDGITKSQTQKVYPMDPPNQTDVEESIKRVKDDDSKLIELNMNNIKNISDEKLEQLFKALPENEHLEVLSLTNVGLTDRNALLLAEAIEKSKTLRVLNVETNFISPPVIVLLVKSLLKCRTVEEFRATNQRSSVLGNKIEMEITELVEKNNSLLRLGLHLEYNDARHRVAAHLQRNIDRSESSSNNHDTKGTTVTDKKPSASILALLTPNMASSSFDKSQTVDKSLFEMQDSSQSFINNNNNNNNTSNIVVEVNLMGGDNNPKSNNFSTITNDNNNKIYETSTTLHLSGKLNSNLNTSNTKTETISSIISTDSSTITTTTTNNFSSSDIIISNIDKLTTTIDQVAIADDIISTTLNTVNTDAMKISSIDKAHIEIKKNIDEKLIIEQTNILTDINSNNDENICSTIAETANSVQQQINISGENQMNEKEI